MGDRTPEMAELREQFLGYIKGCTADLRQYPDAAANQLIEMVERHFDIDGPLAPYEGDDEDGDDEEEDHIPQTMTEIMAFLEEAYGESAAGRHIGATNMLVDLLDHYLRFEEIAKAQLLLASINATRLPPEALTGTLSVGWHAKKLLGASYTGFRGRVLSHLANELGIDDDRLDSIKERFGDNRE